MGKTRTVLTIVAAALTALLVACGPASSMNPLFTDDDLIFDPGLLGVWTEKGPDHASLRFEQAGPAVYRLIDIEPDRNGGPATERAYEAHLVRLGAYRFLDVAPLEIPTDSDSKALGPWPASPDPTQPRLLQISDGVYMELQGSGLDDAHSPPQASLRRSHWIFKLQSSGRTLKLAALDDDWLKNAIDQGDIAIAHSFVDRNNKELVITAPAGELQHLVLEHATDRKAFPDSTAFVKLN
jgi:hypothetical protein